MRNRLLKKSGFTCLLLFHFFLISFCVKKTSPEKNFPLNGFSPIFDGQTLTGWRKLSESPENSGIWEVKDEAVVAQQTPEGQGGLLVTLKTYRDFEVYAEVKADYPVDSGIFLRVQPNVLSYQLTIDYRPDGEVGAIYCPGGGGFLLHNPGGQNVWKRDAFNAIRVRIEGQPPHIQAWINGHHIVDYTDTPLKSGYRVPDEGFLGIQVHGGPGWGKGNKVYFRKLFIKELNPPSSWVSFLNEFVEGPVGGFCPYTI